MKKYIKEILLVIVIILQLVCLDYLVMIDADTRAQAGRIEDELHLIIEDKLDRIQIGTNTIEYLIENDGVDSTNSFKEKFDNAYLQRKEKSGN